MKKLYPQIQRLTILLTVAAAVMGFLLITENPATDIKAFIIKLGAIVVTLLWLPFAGSIWEAVRRFTAVHFCYAGMFLAFLVAGVFSGNIGHSLVRSVSLVAAYLVIVIASSYVFRNARHVWGLCAAVCVSCAAASLYGIVQFAGLDPLPWADPHGMIRNAPSTFGNPNVAVHAIIIALVVAVGLGAQRGYRWAWLVVPLFAAHIVIAESRAGVLVAVAVTLFVGLAYMLRRGQRPENLRVFYTLGGTALTGIVAVGAVMAATYAMTAQVFPQDNSTRLRYHTYYETCEMILDRPIVGHGPGMFEVVQPSYRTEFQRKRFEEKGKRTGRTHNEPLEVASEAGIAAAVFFLCIILFTMRNGLIVWFRNGDAQIRAVGLIAACVQFVFLIDGLIGFNFHSPASALIWTVFTGAALGVYRQDDQPSMEPRQSAIRVPDIAFRIAVLLAVAVGGAWAVRDFASRTFHHYGNMAALANNADAAERYFNLAVRLTPFDWQSQYEYGRILIEIDGRAEEGIAALERAAQLHPNHTDARLLLAEALFNYAIRPGEADPLILLEAAEYHAKHVTELNPKVEDAWGILGRSSFWKARAMENRLPAGDPAGVQEAWKTAEANLRNAVGETDADQFVINRLIAEAILGQGDVERAQQDLLRAVSEQPHDLDSWLILIQLSRQLGSYEDLIAEWDWRIEAFERDDPASNAIVLLRVQRVVALADTEMRQNFAICEMHNLIRRYVEADLLWATLYSTAAHVGREEILDDFFVRSVFTYPMPDCSTE